VTARKPLFLEVFDKKTLRTRLVNIYY